MGTQQLSGEQQPDLFESTSLLSEQSESTKLLTRTTTLSVRLGYEHVALCAILLLLGFLASFAFGLDQGEKRAQRTGVRRMAGTPGAAVASHAAVIPNPTSTIPNAAQDEPTPPAAEPVEQAAPSAAPVRVTEPTPEEHFSIQVASYRKALDAEAEVNRLKRTGHSEVAISKKGVYTIVLVGRYFDRAEAASELPKLKQRYKDCFVRKISHESTS